MELIPGHGEECQIQRVPRVTCFQKSALVNFVQQNALGGKVGDSFNRISGAQSQESQFSGLEEANYQTCGVKDL
jgi:hypothetical protein